MVSTRFKNCRRTFGLPELDNFDGALIFFENRQHLQFAELKKNGNRSWSGVISLKFNTNFSSVQFKRFLMFFHISHRHSKVKSGLMCTPITSEIIRCTVKKGTWMLFEPTNCGFMRLNIIEIFWVQWIRQRSRCPKY